MATTVNDAFSEFLTSVINISASQNQTARDSRDNLILKIDSFSGNDDFFNIYKNMNLKFGSYARNTKTKPLDDIDLMICISADGRKYNEDLNGEIRISSNESDDNNYLNHDNNMNCYLNSTKVINRFITKLKTIGNYKNAEMHKNHEAATLQLSSYDWNFDIVPCFYTVNDFYLIPDGNGNWKKTDPRIDNERAQNIDEKFNNNLLPLIRLIKYWNSNKSSYKIQSSYLLECMIISRYENVDADKEWWIDIEFRNTLDWLSQAILHDVDDPKGIQGNLNSYEYLDRNEISNSIKKSYNLACEAIDFEINKKDNESSINKWRELFGDDFPKYDGDQI